MCNVLGYDEEEYTASEFMLRLTMDFVLILNCDEDQTNLEK
jgi:hypothetical protein